MADAARSMDIPTPTPESQVACATDAGLPGGTGPLRSAAAPVVVRWLAGTRMGRADLVAPHRHDYHELIWTRRGSGRHLLDGAPVEAGAGTVTIIGRGQVHRFDEAREVHGAVVDFSDEALLDLRPGVAPGDGERLAAPIPSWLLVGQTTPTVDVPQDVAPALEALLHALDAEASGPADARASEVQRHLLAVLLLWLDRWHDHGGRGDVDAAAHLHARFARLLETDFARHHDAAHYAEALRVPPAVLSRTLLAATGRTTKDLVLDRVVLEASRLLRFTDLGVAEVADRCGYRDPLYFSRAFKRRRGLAPQAWREAARGA